MAISPPSEYWKLDEAADPRVGSILGIQMVQTSGPPPLAGVPGFINNGLDVPAVGGATYGATTALIPYVPGTGISLAFWIKFTANNTAGTLQIYFGFGTGAMGLLPNPAVLAPNLRAFVWLGGADFTYLDLGNFSLGTWYFFALTFNQVTKEMRFSVNDSIPVSAICVGSAPGPFPQTSTVVDGSASGYGAVVDEIGLWADHVLSSSEIEDLYRAGNGNSYPFSFFATVASVQAAAACFRCIPRSMMRDVQIYLLCQWANTMPAAECQSSFLAALAAPVARNDFSGVTGFEFQVTAPMTVTRIGRYFIAQNTHDHTVRLWITTDTVTPIADVTVLVASASDALGFKFTDLATPVTLVPGSTYRIGCGETATQDMWKDDWDPTGFLDPHFTTVTGVYHVGATNAFPENFGTVAGHIYQGLPVCFLL